jgi:hypothetical protein
MICKKDEYSTQRMLKFAGYVYRSAGLSVIDVQRGGENGGEGRLERQTSGSRRTRRSATSFEPCGSRLDALIDQ